MSTQRLTISLPSDVVERVRREAKRDRRPVSKIVAEALAKLDEEAIRQRMIEGYIATREEGERLAEEWLPLGFEALPDDWAGRDLPRELRPVPRSSNAEYDQPLSFRTTEVMSSQPRQ